MKMSRELVYFYDSNSGRNLECYLSKDGDHYVLTLPGDHEIARYPENIYNELKTRIVKPSSLLSVE